MKVELRILRNDCIHCIHSNNFENIKGARKASSKFCWMSQGSKIGFQDDGDIIPPLIIDRESARGLITNNGLAVLRGGGKSNLTWSAILRSDKLWPAIYILPHDNFFCSLGFPRKRRRRRRRLGSSRVLRSRSAFAQSAKQKKWSFGISLRAMEGKKEGRKSEELKEEVSI